MKRLGFVLIIVGLALTTQGDQRMVRRVKAPGFKNPIRTSRTRPATRIYQTHKQQNSGKIIMQTIPKRIITPRVHKRPQIVTEHTIRIVKPNPHIEYNILCIEPDPKAEYSMPIIDPRKQRSPILVDDKNLDAIRERLKKSSPKK